MGRPATDPVGMQVELITALAGGLKLALYVTLPKLRS